MSKVQTRRCFSVRDVTYERLRVHCEEQGITVSAFVEDLVAEKLDAAGVPVPAKADPRKPKADPLPPKIGSGIWEF